jgi:hypothetical protein
VPMIKARGGTLLWTGEHVIIATREAYSKFRMGRDFERPEPTSTVCHAPRKRGIQYAAASRLQLRSLGYRVTRLRG